MSKLTILLRSYEQTYRCSAVGVVVCVYGVHGFEEFVVVDEGADDDEGAEDAPAPEGASFDVTLLGTGVLFVADTAADAGEPHEGHDAASEP